MSSSDLMRPHPHGIGGSYCHSLNSENSVDDCDLRAGLLDISPLEDKQVKSSFH